MVRYARNSWRNKLIRFMVEFDYPQIIALLLLLTIGVVFIYSTGQQVGTELAERFWIRQLQWISLGGCFWMVLTFTDYRDLKPLSWLLYGGCIVLLIAVLFYGLKIYGARRWLALGSGIRIQPSEFAKLGVLLLLATMLTSPRFNVNRFRDLCIFGLVVAVPFIITAKQPDLGSAMILIPIFFSLIFVAGLKWKYIIIAGSVIGVLTVVEIVNEIWEYHPLLKTYQKERIMTFLDPERDIADRGYNQFQARLAVGSGGAWGKGIGEGTQNTLGFLPQTVSNNDFIFSVIAEETGFWGCLLLIGAYCLLGYSIIRTAIASKDDFGRYLAVGTAAIIFSHAFINIGMSIGVMPVTGVCLPFVSYGGSFTLLSMSCLGILQSIYRNSKRY
jgi:rod shape determining protein RodA